MNSETFWPHYYTHSGQKSQLFDLEVTKILCNSLFTFLLSKARQAEQKFKVKKITQPK